MSTCALAMAQEMALSGGPVPTGEYLGGGQQEAATPTSPQEDYRVLLRADLGL